MTSAVVVGAGVLGASLARRLAGEGWEVTLVEQEEPGHAAAASGDHTRLLRCAHGDDQDYSRLARRARDGWRTLERETGTQLYLEAGVAWLARHADGWEAAAEGALRRLGIPCERADAAALFPAVRTDDLAFTLLETEAGVLRAARATRALADAAVARGARLVRARARPDRARVTFDARELEADHVVWACGPWLAGLFGELIALRVTKQDVVYLRAPPAWRTPPMPVFVDYAASFYGHGDVAGSGLKAASDLPGPPFDPDDGLRVADPEAEAAARAQLRHRFGAKLAGASLREARVCQYELTPDSHLIAAPHPEHPGVWLLGGGSGHGFKHGPALADDFATVLRGEAAPDPRFALGPRASRSGGPRATPAGH